ncbi:MAG: proteasome assembly chaperone family protein [Candidatus Micrarchaeia archaeon]
MEKTIIVEKKGAQLNNPVLVEGLPGIGLVGKLAADYMIKELKAEKIADLYSPHFPHQVLMLKKGGIRMLKNSFYVWKNKNGRDVVILVGDVQAVTPEAQFSVCGSILDYYEKLGGKMIFTLGGYGVGRIVDEPRVLGSATHISLVEKMKQYGVIFGEANGAIVGAAGLLLGLGKLRGMRGVCLMGETHGGYVDAKAAKAVLTVLLRILKVDLDMTKLEERAKETETFMKRMEKEVARQQTLIEETLRNSELSYIR